VNALISVGISRCHLVSPPEGYVTWGGAVIGEDDPALEEMRILRSNIAKGEKRRRKGGKISEIVCRKNEMCT
jgi:hypothetical protein